MPPVCSRDDVAYRIYDSAGHVTSASEYVRAVYANAQEMFLSNTTSCEENLFFVIGT